MQELITTERATSRDFWRLGVVFKIKKKYNFQVGNIITVKVRRKTLKSVFDCFRSRPIEDIQVCIEKKKKECNGTSGVE